ncbi:C-type lectin domain family 10 member A-like isoform X3 [Aquarana catesbeiana]|uniref:C-type lectin domain family 10 member A-like isoform X3 n=1 Tax=Aquarana catesbeiana TaxID=8400 RepID=UPI003CC9A6D9
MSVLYKDEQLIQEDPTPNKSPMGIYSTYQGQGVDQTEQNMEVKLRNLSLGVDTQVKKLSQDVSRMTEKLTNTETFIKDMRAASLITKISGMEASVNRILSDDVTGSISNDIQRILGAVARLTEEIRKGNSSADPLCEFGWRHFGLSCYYFSQRGRSWESAKKDCETKKAHLVVINGEEENVMVPRHIQALERILLAAANPATPRGTGNNSAILRFYMTLHNLGPRGSVSQMWMDPGNGWTGLLMMLLQSSGKVISLIIGTVMVLEEEKIALS